MSINISDNYDYCGKKPNFARDLFATLDEMIAYHETYLPKLFECNVLETGKRYRYNINNEVLEDVIGDDGVTVVTKGLKKWREVKEGTGDIGEIYTKNETDLLLNNKVDKETNKSLVSTEDITQITTNKVSIGDISKFSELDSVGTWTDVASAIVSLYGGFLKKIEFNVITGNVDLEYNDPNKTAKSIPLASIIQNTPLDALKNVSMDYTSLSNGDSLVYDLVSTSWKNKDLSSEIVNVAKTYTDEELAKLHTDTAIACDEKPTYLNGVITYKTNGNEHTTTSEEIWFYYYTDTEHNNINQTRFIDGVEFTIKVNNEVNFSDYVNKTNDVVSVLPSEITDVNKDKIPNLSAVNTFRTYIINQLAQKISAVDIVDNVTTLRNDVPLSANQGVVLQKEITDITEDSGIIDSKILTFKTSFVDDKVSKIQTEAQKDKFLKVVEKVDEETSTSSYEIDFVEVEAGGGSADTVVYSNPDKASWTNVKLALDGIISKVFYVNPAITGFTMLPNTSTYEIGDKVSVDSEGISLRFTWTTNKTPVTQTLTGCTITDLGNNSFSATYSGEITSNKTFTLKFSDGVNETVGTKSISFLNKLFYGVSEAPDEYNSSFISSLSSSKFSTSKSGTYSYNTSTNQYAYIAFPVTFGTISTVKIGGFDTEMVDCGTVNFTNSKDYTSQYKIYRTGRDGLGSFSMIVS